MLSRENAHGWLLNVWKSDRTRIEHFWKSATVEVVSVTSLYIFHTIFIPNQYQAVEIFPDANSIERVQQLYEKLELREIYRQYADEMYKNLHRQVADIPSKTIQSILLDTLRVFNRCTS